jgi:hypothetical protein
LEARDGKSELVEEVDFERHEERGGHVRKKRLQVFADAREGEPAEVGKRDVGDDEPERQVPQAPDIAVLEGGTEADLKCLGKLGDFKLAMLLENSFFQQK